MKHKNDVMDNELVYFRKLPDRNEDLKRELMLRESEDRRYALSQ